MAKKEINVALIGHQFMGRTHSNAYRKVNFFFDLPFKVRQKVICGVPLEGVEAVREKYGWEEASDDWKAVVNRDDIDVVDVCTPGYLHHPMVLEAARAGKHIICEKPLANTLKESKEMLTAVKKAGVKHMCAFSYRTCPAVALAKELIESGKLGTIYHFRAAYQQDWIVDPEFPMVWRLKKKLTGSGALGDIGAHITDMARFLIGDFDQVTATMETFIKKRPVTEDMTGISRAKGAKKAARKMDTVDVDDAAIFLARFKNGALGTFEATRFATGCKNRHNWEIYGSKGSLRWDFEKMNELQYYNNDDPANVHGFREIMATDPSHPYVGAWWPAGHIIGYEHTFVHEIYNFLSTLDKKKINYPDFADGVACQVVLDAVEESSASGRWVKIK